MSKDELFAAVWPNLTVTDDALVQSIGELRRALGDDGPRLIKTIPRRGYRFEPNATVVGARDQASSGVALVAAASRDAELVTGVLTPPPSVANTLAVSRIVVFTIFTLAVLLAGGALWSGEWKLFNVLAHVDRPPTKVSEIGARPAMAVLPFFNQGNDSTPEYFADGLTQDIINALGRFSELTVMSWNAVRPYKGRPSSPAEVGRNLGVRYQVEGSVRQTGDRVRVTSELVDTNGRVLWSARFDEALTDLFALQDKITTQIAGALAIGVTQSEQRRVFAKPPENLEAYDYVLRARPALQRPTRAGNVEARALLRHAIELDPNYAAAHSALAETYDIDVVMGWAQSPATSLGRAEEMAIKALNLSNSDVRAHVILGRIHLFHHRYEQARAEIDRAITLNPSDAEGLAGRGNILMWSGQTDAAIEALELAQRIDPELNAVDRNALALAYFLKGRYEAAIEQAQLNLRKTPDAYFSYPVLAAAYAEQGRAEEAAHVVTNIRRVDPTFDPQTFGSKFLNPADLENLRDGLRKAYGQR